MKSKNKKYLLGILAAVLLVVLVLATLNFPVGFNFKNLLGNVVGIDINSLKMWQQNSGFRKNFALNEKGSDLKLLQKALSTDSEIYPEGKATGLLDPDTSRALKSFQAENSLPETGVFDKDTRAKMNDIFYGELCPVQTVEYPDYTDFVFEKNKNKLPDDFIPKDLEKITEAGVRSVGGIVCLRSDALTALAQMFNDAKEEDIYFAVSSGFRKQEIQGWLVDYYLKNFGPRALNGIALPGYSEHQLGTAVDLTGKSVGYQGTDDDFYKTKEYKWLLKNAENYGFYLSYPRGNLEYKYEPWHWRYWGVGGKNE